MLASLARRILPCALVIIGLAAIFHVGEHMAVLPIGCAYYDGVTFLKWPWQRCRVGRIEIIDDGTGHPHIVEPTETFIDLGPIDHPYATYYQDSTVYGTEYDRRPYRDPTWYWPWWRMSLVQAYTLMALGIVWIALRKRESGS
jgi:hypothetical protein